MPADRWIDGLTTLTLGGMEFRLQPVGLAHARGSGGLVPGLLFAGDLVFTAACLCRPGRQPPLDRGRSTPALPTTIVVVRPRAGSSTSARADLQLTRLPAHLRLTMGEAARNMEPSRKALCEGRLVALRQAAAVPGRQSHQRLQHLSADGHEAKEAQPTRLPGPRPRACGGPGSTAPAAPGEARALAGGGAARRARWAPALAARRWWCSGRSAARSAGATTCMSTATCRRRRAGSRVLTGQPRP